eukprot:TRINITY_DN2902_c0_g1_i14.p3 TRINITY_DN2902_c0_g1~~TRINITY_DN2902_c0_g1_i14.p3  ORF type:complete len:105 (-),score=2.16 TRINITY_DN2902_c0_g1_i14:56-370(-)
MQNKLEIMMKWLLSKKTSYCFCQERRRRIGFIMIDVEQTRNYEFDKIFVYLYVLQYILSVQVQQCQQQQSSQPLGKSSNMLMFRLVGASFCLQKLLMQLQQQCS